MIQTSTVTQKGQITIPYLIRQKMAIETGSKVSFIFENEKLTLSPLPSFFDFRGSIKSKKPFDVRKMRAQVKKHLASRYGKNS
ncbi:MAG: AbrB/MazE/SpoVT family DNA-binding domain-containing protein [Patescibacteria group bacterium]